MTFVPNSVELPEIPFVATPSTSSIDEEDEEGLWPGLMERGSSSSPPSRPVAVLGQASQRILCHSRTRSGSVSSTASRPAPARSILSSSSSIRKKRRPPPSVKFLDTPTIHYDDDDEQDGSAVEPAWLPGRTGKLAHSAPPDAAGRPRVFGILRWFTNSGKNQSKSAPERPSISGPFPLWEAPHRGESVHRCNSPTSARSIRSVHSTNSLRSTRSMRSVMSCASRIQGYWNRVSGRDP